MKSVGALIGDKNIGTIFRVGRQYGMTAAHVIDSIINPHNLLKGREDLNQLTHCCVQFRDRGKIFKLKPVLHFKDNRLDVAVVEFLVCDIRRLPPPLQLVRDDVSSTLKSAVMIGYGNPEQSGKFLESGVDVIQQHDIPKKEIIEFINQHKKTFRTALKIYGRSADIVETGYLGCEADTLMLLNCMMGPGASGSPVFTTEYPASLKVTGLFICGYPKMYYEFPDSVQKKFPLEFTFEAATKTSAIYDAMCKNKKTKLAKAIFGC
ncbi:uncharacterized protein LOC128554832 [Mercenaria mercenaria]|uniref:uncharacterized protein LOC128554832 n=1 Tax=Mercenaria mercenaria TaxID=6596 RepID=UPI00234FAC8F|nr:uncharacterized protein LOC128554832 [Mercenaria mercenaria]